MFDIVFSLLVGLFYATLRKVVPIFLPRPWVRVKGFKTPITNEEYERLCEEVVFFFEAILLLIATGVCMWVQGFNPYRKNTKFELMVCASHVGYTLQDIYFHLTSGGSYDYAHAAHHVAVLSGTSYFFYFPIGATYVVSITFWTYITDPCHSAKVLLHTFKVENHELAARLHVLIYWICHTSKVCFGMPMIYFSLLNEIGGEVDGVFHKCPFVLKIVVGLLYSSCIVWFIKSTSNLWKSLPYWSSNPEKFMSKKWWLIVRESFHEYTTKSPYKESVIAANLFFTVILPVTMSATNIGLISVF